MPEKYANMPNAYGLIGLLEKAGNWCWDRYAPYTPHTKINPTGDPSEAPRSERAYRGKSPTEGGPKPLYARNRADSGDPQAGLRLAVIDETPFVMIPAGEFEMGDSYQEIVPED